MIISFKYKFIFIKNYKTAGSSIERYLYNFLTKNDIIAPTNLQGINWQSKFDAQTLIKNFDKEISELYINRQAAYFAHMPAWLIRERIGKKIFSNFFKFAVLRNPWDQFVSHFHWLNNINNKHRINISWQELINDLEFKLSISNNLFNYYKISEFQNRESIIDSICNFDDLDNDLNKVFKFLNIPYKPNSLLRLNASLNRKDYKVYFNSKDKNLIKNKFSKEIDLMEYVF